MSGTVSQRRPVSELELKDADCLCLPASIDSFMQVLGIYRSPYNASLDIFLVPISQRGDLNIDLLAPNPKANNLAYLTLMAQYGLLPAISQPCTISL